MAKLKRVDQIVMPSRFAAVNGLNVRSLTRMDVMAT